ncbi:MAG: CVNH domain-containing protein [Helicobacteraceae bacterium]|jgi:hypothetical protein|nr:CVNH domain-containing protein [Helicobacteraceae bacterium]
MRTRQIAFGRYVVVAIASLLCAGTLMAANPAGSYTQTCSNIKLNGENLSADCKRMNGSNNHSTLEFATSCVGNVSNVDGHLVCTGPIGSFARTCRNTRVEGNIVYSNCQRISGSWKDTQSSFSGFQHPLTNCDGNLVDKPTCN